MTHDRVRSDYVVFMPCACCNSGVLHSIHVLKTLHPSHFEHNFSIACGKFIGAILPDLSKAFDLVNYDILLTKLSMYFTT